MAHSQRLENFERERPHLLAVAFRILGTEADAEDVVQETWIKYDAADTGSVRNLPAWLTTVAARICLDVLRRRHDVSQDTDELIADRREGPEEIALLANELSAAFAIVLNELTPPQRVALVLHDAFGVPFDEIAHILDTSSVAAKKLASRARERVRHRAGERTRDFNVATEVVAAFMQAVQEGSTDRLVQLLDPNVVRTADPQSLRRGMHQRLCGVRAVAAESRVFQENASRARLALIDGEPGIIVLAGTHVQLALVVDVAGNRIVRFDVIADPQRLALLRISQ